jgi:hypothetical protein
VERSELDNKTVQKFNLFDALKLFNIGGFSSISTTKSPLSVKNFYYLRIVLRSQVHQEPHHFWWRRSCNAIRLWLRRLIFRPLCKTHREKIICLWIVIFIWSFGRASSRLQKLYITTRHLSSYFRTVCRSFIFQPRPVSEYSPSTGSSPWDRSSNTMAPFSLRRVTPLLGKRSKPVTAVSH